MIIMFNHNDYNTNICIEKGETKVLKLNNYNGEYNQGIAAKINDNLILGLYTNEEQLYLVKNNQIFNITGRNVFCQNIRQQEKRKFILILDEKIVHSEEYTALCTFQDLVCGECEEDIDFLLELSNILSSKESMDKFVKGYSYKKLS